MKTLLIILLVFPLTGFAKTLENDFSKAQSLWSDFRNCQSEVKNELNLINCAERLIDPDIVRYEKGKLISYLAQGFSFSELYECGEAPDLLPLIKKPGEKYFCMNVLGNTSRLPGFIIVTSKKNRFKLSAIKYNDKFQQKTVEKL